MAARPSTSSTFSGKSKHGRYVLTIQPTCGTAGCHRATSVSISFSPGHPNKRCNGAYALLPTDLKRDGTFKTSGQLAGSQGNFITFTVVGKFITANKVRGKLTGPNSCGGTDKYTLVAP